jgi:hypothetical protein
MLKVTLTGVLAALALASAFSAASARSFSTSNREIRVTWGPLQFGNAFTQIRCHVTLEGSLHNMTIAKVLGSLVGYITRAIVNHQSCRDALGGAADAIPWNGTETSLGVVIGQSLPWHVTYEGFTAPEGLPAITGIIVKLRGVKFNLSSAALRCLATYGSATETVKGTLVRDIPTTVITGLRPGTERIRKTADLLGRCPEEGEFGNTGIVTLLGSTARISITLI